MEPLDQHSTTDAHTAKQDKIDIEIGDWIIAGDDSALSTLFLHMSRLPVRTDDTSDHKWFGKLQGYRYGKGVWSLKQDHLDIICFADGNNAIIVHVGNEYYAANGTAKQFIDYDKNEGLVSTDNKLIQLHPWPGGAHLDLHTPVIDAGFKLCPRKSMDEKVAATVAGMTRNAADTPKAETPAKSPTIIVVKKPATHCNYRHS